MISKSLKIQNPEGLHARPAGVLSKIASQFQSDIMIEANGVKKSAKSMMSLMSLALEQNDEFTIEVSGSDEETAAETIQALVENQFNIQ
jgi:phosphocarrier protein HPr